MYKLQLFKNEKFMRISLLEEAKLWTQTMCIAGVTLQNYTLISCLTKVIYKSCMHKLCDRGSLCYIIALISGSKKVLYKSYVH